MNPNQYQNAYVEMSDGRLGLFSGPVFVTASDSTLTIKSIKFSLPKELPDGLTWEQLSADVEKLSPK